MPTDAPPLRSRDPFGLSPQEYWTNPHRTVADIAWDRIGEHAVGVALGGPPALDIEVRDTLPMLAFHSDTTAGLAARPFNHAVAVGSRLDQPAVRAAVVGQPPDEPMDSGGGTQAPSPGFAGEPHDLEFRHQLAIPWEPGSWLFTILLGEHASNRVAVSLTRGALRYVDPEVERVLAERRTLRPPLQVEPPFRHPLVTYGRQPGGPEIPAEQRIALGFDARLRIAFRLPVDPADVLPEGEVRAVVPLWLVITGSRSVGPVVRCLHAPSFDEVDGGMATGEASVDVLGEPAYAAAVPQTLFVYAFSRAAMAGPAAIELPATGTDRR
jgi:hypothetical protein